MNEIIIKNNLKIRSLDQEKKTRIVIVEKHMKEEQTDEDDVLSAVKLIKSRKIKREET